MKRAEEGYRKMVLLSVSHRYLLDSDPSLDMNTSRLEGHPSSK
jgi:hypothetical protein